MSSNEIHKHHRPLSAKLNRSKKKKKTGTKRYSQDTKLTFVTFPESDFSTMYKQIVSGNDRVIRIFIQHIWRVFYPIKKQFTKISNENLG